MNFDKADKDIVDKLSFLTYDKFINLIEKTDSKNIDEQDYWNLEQFKFIKCLAIKLKKNNYKINQKYSCAKNQTEGRQFVQGVGIQKINRYFRGSLCQGIFYDVDMINCHLQLLLKLCKDRDIECSNLNKYCRKRDDIINNIIDENEGFDRAVVKTLLFIKSINTENRVRDVKIDGKIKKIKSKFFEEFDIEIKNIQTEFLGIYRKESNHLKKLGKIYNHKGCLMSFILCRYESEILERVSKQGFQVNVKMFDGYMTVDKVDEEYIKKLNKITKKDLIKWSIKPHDLSLRDDILEIEETKKQFIYDSDMINLGKKIYNDYFKEILFCINDIHFYIDNGLINSKLKSIKKQLYNFITANEVLYFIGEKEVIVSKSKKQIDELSEVILCECDTYDNNYLDSIERNTKDKILFNNGYYDFTKNKFIDNFNGIQSFIRIDRNYSEIWDEKLNEQILKRVFYPIFGIDDFEKDKINYELMEYFLQRIARTIAGKVEDKKFLILRGNRDCGKGVITYGFNCAFENYVYPVEMKSFFNTMTNGDQAKNNSFMLDFRFRRLAVGQETKMSDKEFIDGSRIKQFCSGGDELVARKNFQDETKFKVQSGLLFCVNDMLNIKPLDTMEKCDEFHLSSKFVDKNFKDSQKLNGIKYYNADEDIKKWLEDEKVRNQLILLLIKYYNREFLEYPKSLKEELDEIQDNSNSSESIVKKLFVQGGNDDIISNNELREILKESNLQMSFHKFKSVIFGVFDDVNLKFKNREIRGISGVVSSV